MRQGNCHTDTTKYFYLKEVLVVLIYFYQILYSTESPDNIAGIKQS